MRYLPLLLVMLAAPMGLWLGITYPFAGGIMFGGALLASLVGLYDLLQTNRAPLYGQ